jgi:hypothetical protein
VKEGGRGGREGGRDAYSGEGWGVFGQRITRERSCSVLGAKRKARDSCLVLGEGPLESVVVGF